MTVRKLSTSQQVRLMQYLDDELLTVERDVNKRTDPDSPIPSLSSLIGRLEPILHLITSIPGEDPTGYIRIQYLLRFTSGLREWFSGYSITGQGVVENISAAQKRTKKNSSKAIVRASRESLRELLAFIDRLDLAWRKVLTADIDPQAEDDAKEKSKVEIKPEFPVDDAQAGPHRNLVSVTDKIRLRSSILSLRERLLSWSEKQSYLLSESKEEPPAEESETDLSALEDEVDRRADSDADDNDEAEGVFRWRAEIVNMMRGTLEQLDL